jgi:hypothetical protein
MPDSTGRKRQRGGKILEDGMNIRCEGRRFLVRNVNYLRGGIFSSLALVAKREKFFAYRNVLVGGI